jgi:Tfp pilus assembly protein PilF
LAFQLSESPFLKAMDDEQLRQALRSSGRPVDARVTSEIARDVCVREGEKATLEGSIARLGTTYLLSLQAINCQSGETIAREQVQAADNDEVVRALATAMMSMRRKLGESLPSLDREQRAYVHRVTTTSVAALQAFYLGDAEWMRTLDSRAAIPFYTRATQLDPNFALAWAVLSLRHTSVGDVARAQQYMEKAYSLIDHVSERERLLITAQRLAMTGDFAQSIEVSEVLARTYPRDPVFPGNLARLYNATGQFAKALASARVGITAGPKMPWAYVQGTVAAMQLNRPDDAQAIVAQAFAEGLDASALHALRLQLSYITDDATTQEIELISFRAHPDARAYAYQANDAAARGKATRVAELFQKAEELARAAKSDIDPQQIRLESAVKDALFGHCPTRRAESRQPPLVAALCGDVVTARKLTGEPAEAGRPPATGLSYLRAQTLLAQGRKEAAASFDAILEQKAAYWGAEYAAAHVGRARAAAQQGDTATARRSYERFFALWSEADADVPLLAAAGKEYAMLP